MSIHEPMTTVSVFAYHMATRDQTPAPSSARMVAVAPPAAAASGLTTARRILKSRLRCRIASETSPSERTNSTPERRAATGSTSLSP